MILLWSCLFEKVASNLESEIRRSKLSISAANISCMFPKKLILSWPNSIVLGSVKRWFFMLARSLTECSINFDGSKGEESFKKGEFAYCLRYPWFSDNLTWLNYSLIFQYSFIKSDVSWELNSNLLQFRCLWGFMFVWLIAITFFIQHSPFKPLIFYLSPLGHPTWCNVWNGYYIVFCL